MQRTYFITFSFLIFIPLIRAANHHSEEERYIEEANTTHTLNKHEPRFGFPITYGNDLQGFNSGASSYTPVKIELGGIFLGTLIGLGAVLLAPKLAHIFSPPSHGGGSYSYSRALEGNGMLSGINGAISKIDEVLQENNIDSTSCLERAACSYVQSVNPIGNHVKTNYSSSFVDFFIDGSKLKSAIERGMRGDSCSQAYPQCSITKNSLVDSLKTIMISNKI